MKTSKECDKSKSERFIQLLNESLGTYILK